MKKILFITTFFFSISLFAQKDKTLLWEISGNGLSKKSYVYGTMHVNDKISYYLSDSFFKNLLNADIVSTESDPETWDEMMVLTNPNEPIVPYNFYSTFYLKPIKKKDLKTIFSNENYFSSMLSGVEGIQSDYQENTVLDMFIYQTGRKYKKKIVGLENAKTTMLNIMKVGEHDARPDEKNREPLMKLIKSGNFVETLNDYYREKDITMLDSIYKLMFSKKFFEVMISDRNAIMTKSIDSLARTGSLFAAVGAAHLAGKTGIIQLLRERGYTVSPVYDVISEKGQNQKKAIEEYFPQPTFEIAGTADGMVKMPLNKKIIHSQENIGSPDFTNGGAINIKRIPLNYFLNTKNETFNPKALDSLFYENIAGNILEKKYFQEENYSGYDIKNSTKNGNSQHWRFYITPLELITVSMTGMGNYTKQFEKEVFDNLKMKPFSNSWEKMTPAKGGFSVLIPSFNTVYGNTLESIKNIDIQAFDNIEKGYYFVSERTMNNTYVLEDSDFEQKQMHYEFYLQHDIDSTNTRFDRMKQSFTSESKLGNKTIKLKSTINGNKYYLLGTINASDANSSKFFDSFTHEKFNYSTPTKTLSDTISNFKVDIPEQQNERIFLDLVQDKFKAKNIFTSKGINYTFNSESGTVINFEYFKYPKYATIKNLDTLKNQIRRYFLNEETASDYNYDDKDDLYYQNATSLLDYNLNSKKGFSPSVWYKIINWKKDKYEIMSESASYNPQNNTYVFNALVTKQDATQAIKYKVIFNEESKVTLATLVNRNYKNDDPFIERTYSSFTVTEKNKASVFNEKLALFIADAKSKKDTIRFSAMNSAYELEIDKNDFQNITEFIDAFQFKDTETNALQTLIEKTGKLEDKRVVPYLEKIYKKDGIKTAVQISILNAISHQKTKLAYKKIMELLEYDLPVSDNEYEISSMFNYFEKDLENSKELFPKIFQFYSIKEYNVPIIDFCNKLFDANLVNPKKLKSYRRIINTNAKLEYKRILSWKEKNPTEEEIKALDDETEEDSEEEIVESVDEYASAVETDAPVNELLNYMNLLANFQQDDATKKLMGKIKTLNIPQLNIELIRLGILNSTISPEEIETALNDSKTRYATIQLLVYRNKENQFEKISNEEIATSAVINFDNILPKDSISLIDQEIIEKDGKKMVYYFFQIVKKPVGYNLTQKKLYTIAFVLEDNKINPLAYKIVPASIIEDNEDIKKKCKNVLSASLNDKHFRASFEKQKEENNPFMYNEF